MQIASALSISVYFLPDVLKRFQHAYPKVQIEIRSGHSKAVLDMVLGGEAEIGLARSLQHPEVETFSLRDDPLLLVVDAKHRPLRWRHALLNQVATWPLIFYERGSSDWTLTSGLFRRAGLVPNVVYEVDSIETAKRMVERGLGLAFLPQLAMLRADSLRPPQRGEDRRCRTPGPQSRCHPSTPAAAGPRGPGFFTGHATNGFSNGFGGKHSEDREQVDLGDFTGLVSARAVAPALEGWPQRRFAAA